MSWLVDDRVRGLKRLVDRQADDEGLWFLAATAPEAYLQSELRALHHAVERLIEAHAEESAA